MGSPSLLTAQGWVAPSARKSWLPAMGPSSRAPVVLSKTAKDSLTHWTYCVAPTAPLVSGGAEFTEKLGKPLPRPSKLSPVAREPLVANVDWTTGSLEPPPPPGLPLLAPGTARKGLSCLGPSDWPLRIPWTVMVPAPAP